MSVAIVAMVNHSAISGHEELIDDECDAYLTQDQSDVSTAVIIMS